MRKLSLALFGLSLLMLFLSLGAFFIKGDVIQTESFYTSVTVTENKGGFDVNDSALTFGYITRGGGSTRKLIFDNPYNFPIVAEIKVEGEIDNLMAYDSSFYVEPESSTKIPFSVSSPEKGELGFYSGEVFVEIRPA